MTVGDAAARVVDVLESLGIPYMLVGAFSSGGWGIPRSTKDVDVVLSLTSPRDLRLLEQALGPDFEFDEQITFETITGNVRHIVEVKNAGFDVEFFELSKDAFQQERFARRIVKFLPAIGRKAQVPTAEDVVVQKIRWGRPKDLDDAKDVMAVQGEALDYGYIESWCSRHGTLERLDKVRAEIPPI